ncbi:DUF4843 domain-containing protein [Alistipes sp. OttesenSCG-928-B03]|nr:DUF4843 domain-containing protein [Alistipes sp. OttesenSCG-928-B03]
MKKIIFIVSVILASGAFAACDQDNYTFYEKGRDAIYFSLPQQQRDSMVVSLAKYLTDEVELKIPVELAGYPSSDVRYYKVRVVTEKTTAVAGVHYKALDEKYAFRADDCFDSLRVTLYTTDPDLLLHNRRLYLELVPTEDLGAGIEYKQHADLRFGTGLQKPDDWYPSGAYPEKYQYYLGEYSSVKHALVLALTDIEEIPDKWDGNVALWDYAGMRVNQYVKDNVVLDENGIQIQPWR